MFIQVTHITNSVVLHWTQQTQAITYCSQVPTHGFNMLPNSGSCKTLNLAVYPTNFRAVVGKLVGCNSHTLTHMTLLCQVRLHTQLFCNSSSLRSSCSCITHCSHARHFFSAHHKPHLILVKMNEQKLTITNNFYYQQIFTYQHIQKSPPYMFFVYQYSLKMALRNCQNVLKWSTVYVDEYNLLWNLLVTKLIYVGILQWKCTVSTKGQILTDLKCKNVCSLPCTVMLKSLQGHKKIYWCHF
jgi:hypothetical protein